MPENGSVQKGEEDIDFDTSHIIMDMHLAPTHTFPAKAIFGALAGGTLGAR